MFCVTNFLLNFLFLNTNFFLLSKTPLSMGLIFLFPTLFISLFSGKKKFNFWDSYILFLMMLGGKLILFIYVSSLSPNQKFSLKKKKIFFIIIFFFMIINFKKSNYFMMINLEMNNFSFIEIENNFSLKMSMNKLYNNPTNFIMIMLINYLLMVLFIVVKITNINMGPLRKKN
uniref:NADH-ubiquinone oxidoreductase chain 6 n=1 Tax=Allantus luctifer TaxID=621237 RepID=A0A0U1WP05_9HYME|nr:NADH dehydrogenase subunit 6 [Allantus luctifer]AIG61941.1 NADH dehydrogenase subunit 6 [Allantus luctifer]